MELFDPNDNHTLVPNPVPLPLCEGYGSEDGSPQEYHLPLGWQYGYGLLCAIISIMGAVGNGIVIWICLYYRRMRTITNFFIANLAAADLLLSICNVPPTSYFILTQNWPFGQAACAFVNFIATTPIVASVLTMMCISIDRYIAIVHPMRPRMSKYTAYVIIVAIWLTGGSVSFPALVYSATFANGNTTICSLQWDAPQSEKKVNSEFIYQFAYMFITYFVPVVALTFAYGRVAKELWGTKSIGEISVAQIESIKSKKKLVKVLIWVMTTCAICWAPFHIWFIVTSINRCVQLLKHASHIFTSSYVLAMSNSVYNPIIYVILNQRFRQGFKQVFQWLPWVHFDPSEALDRPQRGTGQHHNITRDAFSSCHDMNTMRNGGSSHALANSHSTLNNHNGTHRTSGASTFQSPTSRNTLTVDESTRNRLLPSFALQDADGCRLGKKGMAKCDSIYSF
ncbi:hypothetical protein RvY_11802 [Ramazzottius varieornatus]|uniref:G-protein coupled receptors family 1 profile domain-containing protein n=1 Tax=Ramazzottius varieornatus TaxID=947166 RepID=A0A1D1VJQ4_RAMVA|nr:hypothetical protein RvY_11802 [Ramazzottius varieornatus]